MCVHQKPHSQVETFTENSTNEQISFRKMVNKLLVIRIFVFLFDSIISFPQLWLIRFFILMLLQLGSLCSVQTRVHTQYTQLSHSALYSVHRHNFFWAIKRLFHCDFHHFISHSTYLCCDIISHLNRSIFSLFTEKLFSKLMKIVSTQQNLVESNFSFCNTFHSLLGQVEVITKVSTVAHTQICLQMVHTNGKYRTVPASSDHEKRKSIQLD